MKASEVKYYKLLSLVFLESTGSISPCRVRSNGLALEVIEEKNCLEVRCSSRLSATLTERKFPSHWKEAISHTVDSKTKPAGRN